MKDEFISFDTAKLAKENGFNIFTNKSYGSTGFELTFNYVPNHPNCNNSFPKPTQSLLQKWLRERHNIRVIINSEGVGRLWQPILKFKDVANLETYLGGYSTYEKALEKGLQEALKLIKTP